MRSQRRASRPGRSCPELPAAHLVAVWIQQQLRDIADVASEVLRSLEHPHGCTVSTRNKVQIRSLLMLSIGSSHRARPRAWQQRATGTCANKACHGKSKQERCGVWRDLHCIPLVSHPVLFVGSSGAPGPRTFRLAMDVAARVGLQLLIDPGASSTVFAAGCATVGALHTLQCRWHLQQPASIQSMQPTRALCTACPVPHCNPNHTPLHPARSSSPCPASPSS